MWKTILLLWKTVVHFFFFMGFPDGTSGKESACQCRRHKRHEFNRWVRRISWSRKWQLTLVFLPGKSHGQKSLAGYSLWGHTESDRTEQLSTHRDTHPLPRTPLRCKLMAMSYLVSQESNKADTGMGKHIETTERKNSGGSPWCPSPLFKFPASGSVRHPSNPRTSSLYHSR